MDAPTLMVALETERVLELLAVMRFVPGSRVPLVTERVPPEAIVMGAPRVWVPEPEMVRL